MFEAEFEGLIELASSHCIKVPEPLCCGTAGNNAFIAMENLPLGGSGDASQLGQSLAAIHRVTRCSNGQPLYGWTRENTIGSTTQRNDDENNWTTFWVRHRLGFQLDLARRKGANGQIVQRGERLCESLGEFFAGYRPEASLLHGDLWSGNVAFDPTGNPVIFDPAVYYGDRETDLAMTELFGGFSSAFYTAYQSHYPLDEGYSTRKTLYNLYHILNHYNMFGGGYLSQAGTMIDRLLGELQ
jgi:fructosamine-3-kinase